MNIFDQVCLLEFWPGSPAHKSHICHSPGHRSQLHEPYAYGISIGFHKILWSYWSDTIGDLVTPFLDNIRSALDLEDFCVRVNVGPSVVQVLFFA